jgi:hypothetical protein
MFVESEAFKGYQRGSQAGPVATLDLDLRATLFQTSAGWAPESLRTGRVEYKPTRPAPVVVDYFPEYTTAGRRQVHGGDDVHERRQWRRRRRGAYAGRDARS